MLRFFVETMPLSALREPGLLARVARSADGLVLAVRPFEAELAGTVAAVRDAGLGVALWPMLDDAAGRWLTLANAETFVAFARECVQDARLLPEDAVLFDLEPPWRMLDALVHGRLWAALCAYRSLVLRGRDAIEAAEGQLARFAAELAQSGHAVQTAEFPWALAAPGWARAAGVPHLAAASQRGLMLYTSMLEGYSRGLFDRRRAERGLARLGAAALRKLGAGVELQLGAVGAGALHDEPVYRNVAELERELELVRRLGCTRVAVFDLGGILRRPDAERWLGACAHARNLLWERERASSVAVSEEASCEPYFPS